MNNMERFISKEMEKTTGISVVGEKSKFTLEKIREILKKHGFETKRHCCDDPRYSRWFHPKKRFCVICNMAGISWHLKTTEKGTLVRVGTFYGLKIEPMSGDAPNILHEIKEDIFSLVTNNNGNGEIIVPFRHEIG